MSSAPAVDYAIMILEFFAEENKAIGIADISNGLNINKNAVSRVLGALLEHGWIYCCDSIQKKYAMTMKPFAVLSKCVGEDDLQKIARPYVEEIHEKTGDCTYLGIKNNNNIMYTLHYNSTGNVRISGRVGGEYPLHCSAAGKIVLSHLDGDYLKEYFEKYAEAKTPNTITDIERFKKEAERIIKNGYALDLEEFGKGIICIAAPVFDAGCNLAASVGISTLTIFHDEKSIVEEKLEIIKTSAEKISKALGCGREL